MNTARQRRVFDRQIRRLGGRAGAIRRGATTIPIMLSVVDYSTREIGSGDLISNIDRKAVVSTYRPDGTDLGTLPDKDTDTIVLFRRGTTIVESTHIIQAPPKLYDPDGVVIGFELQMRKS